MPADDFELTLAHYKPKRRRSSGGCFPKRSPAKKPPSSPVPTDEAIVDANTVCLGDPSRLCDLFEQSNSKLKSDGVLLQMPRRRVRLIAEPSQPPELRLPKGKPHRADRQSEMLIVPATDKRFALKGLSGAITASGNWESENTSLDDADIAFLRCLLADPAAVFAESGRTIGICTFCGRRLLDERSQRVGYGKTCARHFGLIWGGLSKKETTTEAANSIGESIVAEERNDDKSDRLVRYSRAAA